MDFTNASLGAIIGLFCMGSCCIIALLTLFLEVTKDLLFATIEGFLNLLLKLLGKRR